MEKKIKIIIVLSVLIIPSIIFCIIEFLSNDDDAVKFDNDEMFHTCPDINGEPTEISVDEYNLDFINELTQYESPIFPSEIPASNKYFCFADECLSSAGWVYASEIYLECKYEESDFNNELQRLKNAKSSYHKLVESNDLFSLPSLISVYNDKAMFEYCILDYENLTIKYIYFWGIDKKQNLVFDESLIPTKKLKDSDFPKELIMDGGYSIYSHTHISLCSLNAFCVFKSCIVDLW